LEQNSWELLSGEESKMDHKRVAAAALLTVEKFELVPTADSELLQLRRCPNWEQGYMKTSCS